MPDAYRPAAGLRADAAFTRRSFGARPLLIALLIILCVTLARMLGTVDSDVSWQLWIAGRLNAGAHLYSDIVETNPPLWFWMGMPVDRLAGLLNVRVDAILIIIMGLLAALSVIATDRLVRGVDGVRRTLLFAYVALILTAMPWLHVGQREHIVLLGAVPYAALIAARRKGTGVSPGLAALVGAGAAVGFALKHYFLIVPVLLELWLIAGGPRRWRMMRPETIAIVSVGLAYAGAMLIWGLDFLQIGLPLVQLAYGPTGAMHFSALLQPRVVLGLFALGIALAHWRTLKSDETGFHTALLIASAGFCAVYFIQSKGWVYHTLPLVGCSMLALAGLLASSRKPSALLRVVAPTLLAFPFFLAFEEARHEPLPSPDLLRAVDGMKAGETVGFIAADPAIGWAVTLQRKFRYASRYNGFWMTNAVVGNERNGSPDPRLSELGRQVTRNTVIDFLCVPPQRIIVARPRPGEHSFDILPFFMRDPLFVKLLAHYKPIGRTSLDVYELASPLPPIPRSSCRPAI